MSYTYVTNGKIVCQSVGAIKHKQCVVKRSSYGFANEIPIYCKKCADARNKIINSGTLKGEKMVLIESVIYKEVYELTDALLVYNIMEQVHHLLAQEIKNIVKVIMIHVLYLQILA